MDTTKPFASRLYQAQFAKASTSGERLLARTAQATAANYDAGRIHVELSNGCAFSFPVDHAQGLAGAKVADLRVIEVTAADLGLDWPRLDADLYVYVPTLIKGVLGTKKWMAQIGAHGGRAVTAPKVAASRSNGKLGGRPRKAGPLQAA